MLSMKAKYALRAMIALAKKNGTMQQIKAIAEEADVPRKFLETIMQELKLRGLVNSKRGIFGGYYLLTDPQKITVADIVRVIDGPLAPVRCASVTAYEKCDDCVDEKTCAIKKVMVRVRNAMSEVLDKTTLRELAQNDDQDFNYLSYCI